MQRASSSTSEVTLPLSVGTTCLLRAPSAETVGPERRCASLAMLLACALLLLGGCKGHTKTESVKGVLTTRASAAASASSAERRTSVNSAPRPVAAEDSPALALPVAASGHAGAPQRATAQHNSLPARPSATLGRSCTGHAACASNELCYANSPSCAFATCQLKRQGCNNNSCDCLLQGMCDSPSVCLAAADCVYCATPSR